MSLKKRGKTWHCHFVVNGQRFRQSLETTDWREAQAKEKELIAAASEGKLHQTSATLTRQPFGLAADDYVTARKLELAPASQAKEKQLLVQLRAYFKQEPLKAITAKRIIEYRAWRAEQKVGPATLNAELGILRRILKRAKLWSRVADDIRPLKEPSTIGRALTEDDKQRLLKTAVMRPEWETAFLAAILCLNTTTRGCELKGLQWSDVDLFERTVTVRKSKTAAGVRAIPLTDVACSALARLRTRAESFGRVDPAHYVFAAYGTRMTFNDTKIVGTPTRNSATHAQKFSKAVKLMDESLLRSTGLGELDRKLVTFWTLGTHTLPYVDTFPMLVLLGKMGTGKSQALSIIGNFAYHPVTFSLRGMTAPAIRDEFAGCHEGTAIVEEADSAWNDKDAAFERMLSDRYQRASARASHKVPALDSGWWESVSKPYFGATALVQMDMTRRLQWSWRVEGQQ
jgi:integrase